WPQLPPTYTTPDGPRLGARAWLLGATAQELRTAGPGTLSQALYESVDGGAHWTLVDSALPASSVDFVSARSGFAVRPCFGAVIGCSNPLLLETVDGGVNWVQLHPRLSSGRLRSPLPYM
ncbi:MAG: beta propeller repeat protein, partial [Candidatus Dormibacteria bacterium]